MRVPRMMLLAVGVLSLAGFARAEQVANPTFENWKKFAEGSNSTISMTIEAAGQKMTSEAVNKLVGKTDDTVTVEVSTSMEIAGQKQAIPTQTQKVPSKVEKTDAPIQVGESTEKVEAAGKTFDCKVYEVSKKQPNGQTVKAKMWINDDVPGGVVKMEAKSEQANVSGVLKSFEKK